MSEPTKAPSNNTARNLLIGGLVSILLVGYLIYSSVGSGDIELITFTAKRGQLNVTVTSGGNVEAQQSQEIRSQIQGNAGVKILSIVDEGYLVTQEDIDNGLVLVELDSAAIEDQLVNQQIATESAEATYVERKAQYEIQVNQNQSSISDAKLAVKFARMDFEKYLGAASVKDIADRLELDRRFAEVEVPAEANTEAPRVLSTRDTGPRIRPEGPPEGAEGGASGERPEGGRGGGPGGFSGQRPEGAPEGGFQGGRGGDGRGGGRGFDPERLRQMIADNGGEVPDFMKQRLEEMGITVEELLARMESGDAGGRPEREPEPVDDSAPAELDVTMVFDEEYTKIRESIDFKLYADENKLEDGEAKQMLRDFSDKILVAQAEERLAKSDLEGQMRLAERKFITQNELDVQKVRTDKAEIARESAEMAKTLYIQYTFPKQAEQLLSDYEDALMNLKRTEKEAEARIAQESAQLKAAERKYKLETTQLEEIEDQLTKCVIRAERPGLVVYGSSSDSSPWRRSNEEPIQEGTTVRERQRIITIPDMNHMGVKVNIHESAVKRVSAGQTASIRVDAYPNQLLEGEVTKVAVLADSANAFMNPDLKVYPTVVEIKDPPAWLRPGMSAEVAILIETLNDVVYIPIQAVTFEADRQICYVMSGGTPVKRAVTLGEFTEEFIEIKSGLEEGEEVLLLAPQSDASGAKEEKDEQTESPQAPQAPQAPQEDAA